MKWLRFFIFLSFFISCIWGIIQFAPQLKPVREFPDGVSIVLAFESPTDFFYKKITAQTYNIIEEFFPDYKIQVLEFPLKDPDNWNLAQRYSIKASGLLIINKKGTKEEVIDLINSSRYMSGDDTIFSNMLINQLTLALTDQPNAKRKDEIHVEIPPSSYDR